MTVQLDDDPMRARGRNCRVHNCVVIAGAAALHAVDIVPCRAALSFRITSFTRSAWDQVVLDWTAETNAYANFFSGRKRTLYRFQLRSGLTFALRDQFAGVYRFAFERGQRGVLSARGLTGIHGDEPGRGFLGTRRD